MAERQLCFSQIHIDAARNSTDDFNPFHDKHRWRRIRANPFGGPIVLGFQLECLLEGHLREFRRRSGEWALIRERGLRYSNYQLTFADVVRCGEAVAVEIRPSQYRDRGNAVLGNRVVVRKGPGIVLTGHKKESAAPLFSGTLDRRLPRGLRSVPDRSRLCDGALFLKRKYLNTGNAKNFLSGSLLEQSDWFDELADRARFPETFPTALISCALLERALSEHHDFERQPRVYTRHEISVDRDAVAALRSNDVLHILVGPAADAARAGGLGRPDVRQQLFRCWGLVGDNIQLFYANIYMALLEDIAKPGLLARQAGSAIGS